MMDVLIYISCFAWRSFGLELHSSEALCCWWGLFGRAGTLGLVPRWSQSRRERPSAHRGPGSSLRTFLLQADVLRGHWDSWGPMEAICLYRTALVPGRSHSKLEIIMWIQTVFFLFFCCLKKLKCYFLVIKLSVCWIVSPYLNIVFFLSFGLVWNAFWSISYLLAQIEPIIQGLESKLSVPGSSWEAAIHYRVLPEVRWTKSAVGAIVLLTAATDEMYYWLGLWETHVSIDSWEQHSENTTEPTAAERESVTE